MLVRLWTELYTNRWVYQEYEFTGTASEVTMVGCNSTAYDPAPASYSTYGCNVGATPACTWTASTGTFSCDLQPWTTGTAFPEATLISPPSSEYFHFAAWGTTRSNQKFCCAIRDRGGFIDKVTLSGSSTGDALSFRYLSNGLRSSGQQPLSVEANGRNGGDEIFGPSRYYAGVFPRYNGGLGGDHFVGGPMAEQFFTGGGGGDSAEGSLGDDLMVALGSGGATLDGQGGDDVMVSAGTGLVSMYAGDDDDVTCTTSRDDLLKGEAGRNILYVSSTASSSVPFNSGNAAGGTSRCGKPSWGSSWAGACTYDVSTVPSECSAWVAP